MDLMMDSASEKVAAWLDGVTPLDAGPVDSIWACVEIFGHRRHYGRISEVEKFGTKMLRVDVPAAEGAPLLGHDEQFETFLYGGGSIFSMTPMTEEAARKWAAGERVDTLTEDTSVGTPTDDCHDLLVLIGDALSGGQASRAGAHPDDRHDAIDAARAVLSVLADAGWTLHPPPAVDEPFSPSTWNGSAIQAAHISVGPCCMAGGLNRRGLDGKVGRKHRGGPEEPGPP